MKRSICTILLLFSSLFGIDPDIPVSYQGRIHPAGAFLKISNQSIEEAKVLPGKKGEWFPLNALKKEDLRNFTLYKGDLFEKIQKAYQTNDQGLSFLLRQGYSTLAGKMRQNAHGKALYYPTFNQLKAELFLFQFPFLEVAVILYLVAFVLFAYRSSFGFVVMGLALAVHFVLMVLRSYVLGRPPVSNMYETLIYVPWITAFAGVLLYPFLKNRTLLIGAALGSCALLSILLFSPLSDRLENVQAVLDSQYWLIIHVLMVVGSYGFFILSGILGHLYFFSSKKESLSQAILQTTYIGTGLLITGTILGGVWAAQSWGRFWDWDPKESWAFISCCSYLVLIHLHRFKQIAERGLALGSIIGLQVISFTWYGVNYILGTGLHSYGFENGGVLFYYVFVIMELAFIIGAYLQFNLLHAKIFFTKKQI